MRWKWSALNRHFCWNWRRYRSLRLSSFSSCPFTSNGCLLMAALWSASLYRSAAGIFCPKGSLYFFSTAGGGTTGSAAIGSCALCEGASDGSSAVAGKLLAAGSCRPLCADALAFRQISMTSKVRWPDCQKGATFYRATSSKGFLSPPRIGTGTVQPLPQPTKQERSLEHTVSHVMIR